MRSNASISGIRIPPFEVREEAAPHAGRAAVARACFPQPGFAMTQVHGFSVIARPIWRATLPSTDAFDRIGDRFLTPEARRIH